IGFQHVRVTHPDLCIRYSLVMRSSLVQNWFRIASAIAFGSRLYCALLILSFNLSTRFWRTPGWPRASVESALSVTLSCDKVVLSPAIASPSWFVAAAEDFVVCAAETDCGSLVFNPILII